MGKLYAPPFAMRLPETVDITQKPCMTIAGTASPQVGSKEEQYVILDVWSTSADSIDSVADDLRRLFHVDHHATQWQTLPVDDGQAFIRLETEDDVPAIASNVKHRVMRFRVQYAKQYAY
jgi:hypothetical protein